MDHGKYNNYFYVNQCNINFICKKAIIECFWWNRCRINEGAILGGSPFFIVGVLAVILTICICRCGNFVKDEQAMKELVRNVRAITDSPNKQKILGLT